MAFLNKVTHVPGKGPRETCLIAGVGEQPGKQEVWRGKPFVGPAGGVLDECLTLAEIARSECYLTNVIKDLDFPLKHYMKLDTKRQWLSDEAKQYIEYLREELEGCSANVIVAIGNPALYALTGRVGITKWRSSILESTLLPGRKVIPTLHPATVLPPKNVYLNKHLIVIDLQRVRKESKSPLIRLKEREIITSPSFMEVMLFLRECKEVGLGGGIIDYDIELFNEEVVCISFATSPTRGMSIPFLASCGDYFTPEQEASVWEGIALILENPKITKRGQNIIFDSHFVLRRFGIKARGLHDTMVAQKILFPEYPVALEFITSMYTDIPYYKDDGKRWRKGLSSIGGAWEDLWRYNALDSLACAEAYPKQRRDLGRQDNVAAYERQRRLIEPLTYMMERGTKVDVEGMYKASEDIDKKLEGLYEELYKKVGYEINPNSSKQLIEYFYGEKKQKPYKARRADGTFTVSVNEVALKRLSRNGFTEASTTLEIRGLEKVKSVYLNVRKVDKDGRIRCSYNPSGTRFSRISSSENIFGTGTNLQNWPHECLKFLVADEGYVYYALDLSQAENRIVAYVGKVTQMVEAFEKEMDVHALTAGLIFGVPYDKVSKEPGSSVIGSGKFSQRFWGKKANHAFNYDLRPRGFSLEYEILESQAKWIYNRYHAAYPGIKESYHANIRAQLAKDRTLTNLFGRKTLFLGKWEHKLFKEAYSCIPQGSVGDKINEQGLLYIYENQQWFESVELLNQVHDSIGIQIPLYHGWFHHANILKKVKDSLETPCEWMGREFVIPVDITIGLNLCKEDGIEIKHNEFPSTLEGLASKLEKAYKTLKGKGDKR